MDGGIAVGLLAATPTCRRGIPAHLGIEPDRQRAAALERFIVGWPVPGPVGRGCRSAHVSQLPRWIHEMNPTRDLCNRAVPIRNLVTQPFKNWRGMQEAGGRRIKRALHIDQNTIRHLSEEELARLGRMKPLRA